MRSFICTLRLSFALYVTYMHSTSFGIVTYVTYMHSTPFRIVTYVAYMHSTSFRIVTYVTYMHSTLTPKSAEKMTISDLVVVWRLSAIIVLSKCIPAP